MPIIDFTQEHIDASRVVEPAFYRVKISEVRTEPAKDGKSVNYWLKGAIRFNGDTGDVKYAGVPTPYLWLVNTQRLDGFVPIIEAVKGEKLSPGARINTDGLVDAELDVFIQNGTYKGKVVNEIPGTYRHPRKDVVAKE